MQALATITFQRSTQTKYYLQAEIEHYLLKLRTSGGVVCATYMSVALGTKQVFECYKRRHSMSNPKKTNQLKITRKRITDESKRLNCFGIFRLKLFSLEQKKYTIFSSHFQLLFAFR